MLHAMYVAYAKTGLWFSVNIETINNCNLLVQIFNTC